MGKERAIAAIENPRFGKVNHLVGNAIELGNLLGAFQLLAVLLAIIDRNGGDIFNSNVLDGDGNAGGGIDSTGIEYQCFFHVCVVFGVMHFTLYFRVCMGC